jgi:flavin-dependent amine oxidoreductase
VPLARKSNADAPSVAIVGAGIAGLSAALRLSQRGYDVTLYEEKGILGGNLSSQDFGDGIYHDVYPHMFPDWCVNFWEIIETDLRLKRNTDFEARLGVKFLKEDPDGPTKYLELTNPSNLRSIFDDLLSKFLPLPDMFLLGYSRLDLASTPFDPSKLLSQISVNGFLHSRPYATERSAWGHELLLMLIWSIHGSLTSAASYKGFLKHALEFTGFAPFAWMLKGSLQEKLIAPLRKKLEAHGCKIRPPGGVSKVLLQADGKIMLNSENDSYDYLVLAVPAAALAKLVLDPGILAGSIIREGSIVDQLPGLSELRRLRAERIAVVDLYFKKKLPNIPKEHVVLLQSKGDLTFLDISQLWTTDRNMRDRTVLVLAASDVYALPAADVYALQTDNAEIIEIRKKNAFLMIQTLHKYLPVFNPGGHWGDRRSDINYSESKFLPNATNTLFINEVGSWEWRPKASYEALPNVLFAGDFCRTDVDMATVEAAVLSGLAAHALWKKKPLGKPIVIAKPPMYSDSTVLALKLLLMPFAYGAKGLSMADDAVADLRRRNLARGLISPLAKISSLPLAYTLDWWETAYAFWKSVLRGGRGPRD